MLVVQSKKKTDRNTAISEIEKTLTDHNHDEYITTPEFNNLAAGVFDARLKQANLVTRTEFDTRLTSLNEKNNANKSKHLLVENEFKKLKISDSSCSQVKVILKKMLCKLIQYFSQSENILNEFLESKRLSNERINSVNKSYHSINPNLSYYGTKIKKEFNGSCLKQDKIAYNHEKVVNNYIVYAVSKNFNICSYPTLENCLFGAVSLSKHSDQYIYSGYSIGFDRKGNFSFGNGFGRNVIIFGVDMISSVYVDNKKKDILILGEDPTQGLDGTTLTPGKSIQLFSLEKLRNFCLSLHYNEANSYLFLNNTEIHKFKARDSETVAIPLCL